VCHRVRLHCGSVVQRLNAAAALYDFDGAAIVRGGKALGLRHRPPARGRIEGFFRGLILGPRLDDGALRRRKRQLFVITFQHVLEDLESDPTQERYLHR
jgi:hypothetical protein